MDRLPHLMSPGPQGSGPITAGRITAGPTTPGLCAAALIATGLCVGGSLLLGCDGGGRQAAVPRRVDAVPAPPKAPVDLDDFCEVRPDTASAPRFAWPELASTAPPMSKRWTWVNVWATWCGPCVEELPMILGWPEALATQGTAVEIALLSVDEDAATVSGFRVKNPWLPASARAARPGVVPGWLAGLGLDLPSTLPLHLFVDPTGKVRCGRSGALQPDAEEAIAALIAAG